MFRNRTTRYLVAGFVLFLAVGAVQALVAASEIAPAPEEPSEGFSNTPSNVEYTADLQPPEGVDGEVELNPVNQESLEQLAALRASNDPIFNKYAYLPFCTTSGCPGGIDHLAAGTGARNTGFGTIRLRGLPPGSVAVSAFLYWSYIQGGPIALTQSIVFRGTTVTGFFVSNQPQPCWNGAGTLRTYRASVLTLLVPPINGDYSVRGIPSNLTNGQDPWNPINNVMPLAEGASLVVLYSHSTVPIGSWVQIHHPVTTAVFGTLTFNHLLNQPIQVAATRHTRIAADGQLGFGLNHFNAVSNERTWLWDPLNLPVQIRGNGSYLSGSEDSDLNGFDGEPLNHLWDTHTMNIPGAIPGGPVFNYWVRYSSPNDCVDPVVHVITAR